MQEELASSLDWLRGHPELQTLAACAGLLLLAWVANWLVKRILVRGLDSLMKTGAIDDFGLVRRLSNVVPALIITDRKSTRLNSSHVRISYAVFCLKKKK